MPAVLECEFSRLYDVHRPAVYAYLLGRAGEPETARDLLQETFLGVWRHMAAVRDFAPERQRAWIFAVARNLLIDVRRRHAVARAAQSALEASSAEAAPAGEEPAARAEMNERMRRLDDAIRRLPEPLRVALAMCTVGGLTSAQAGELLAGRDGAVPSAQGAAAADRRARGLRAMSDELDALLERWAEGSRLTEEQAAAILAAVIETPEPGVDPAWLQDLVGRVSGLVVQVATMPEAARAALRTPVLVGGVTAGRSSASQSGQPARPPAI